ncbi:neuromedin-U isoform X2 [Salminus brasiliensis]|uniref:neuromedin-U isoform X2 n=1 Tax=Salminus brasiliensis TaxID=930266 RepID=UPI003B82E49C
MMSSRCPERANRSSSSLNYRSGASPNYRSSASASSSSALSLVHSASLTLAVLLLSAAPVCTSAPAFLNPSTIQHDQLLNQIDNACSSYLSAERPFRTSDVLRDFCGLMLEVLQKSQELSAREPRKRFLFHYTKPNGAGVTDGTEDLQGPGAIQSRGYFLYRPRNGRRSTEYV